MCFRLLAAVHPAPLDLEALAVREGLDVREAIKGSGRFVEIAWGDCACSLYTRRRGRELVAALLEALLAQGCEVELLLARDDEPLDFEGDPETIDLPLLRREGLARLPQGKVVRLSLVGPRSRWVVITGAPSSGKTTLIDALAARGHPVVPEVSRRLIAEGVNAGKAVAQIVGDAAYPFAVTREQLRVEAGFPLDQLAFFDKAAPSQWPYHVLAGHQSEGLFEGCRGLYARVFVLERLPFEPDGIRLEDEAACAQLDRLQEEAYRRLGYPVVRVPAMAVSERVRFILERSSLS